MVNISVYYSALFFLLHILFSRLFYFYFNAFVVARDFAFADSILLLFL